MLSAAEMTRTMFAFAVCAQWSHLIVCPHLTWQSICRPAVVAVEARHQAAINAWPGEPLLRTKGERLKTGHVQAGPRAMAG